MDNAKKDQIKDIVNTALDRAELHWENGGKTIVVHESLAKANLGMEGYAIDAAVPSMLSGHPWVSEDETIISEFVAFVADMRDSTKHLLNAISAKTAEVSQLQRVFYETSALLPALAKTVEFEQGQVTEYLGDGILAFFKVSEDNRADAMYRARRAAIDSIEDTRNIINIALSERYSLPALDIGVGLAMSKAIVSLVGLPSSKQPKAFGECVFRATKMSSGRNEVCVDERMQKFWPKSKGGRVVFRRKMFGEGEKAVSGYLMGKS
ncbi:TPA: adenylate/guanylate cyclase [Enterobacter hormaechei subsp. hoffmannii]